LIEYAPVEYPEEAKMKGIEGDVVARIYVNEYGYVRAVEIEQSAHPILDHAVYVAVKDWKFEPALQKGRPVRAEITKIFPFYKPKIRSSCW
jgi:protein TonB